MDDMKPQDSGKVLDLAEKRRGRPSKTGTKPAKIKPGELQRDLADVIARQSLGMPAFQSTFHIFRRTTGVEIFHEYEPGLVRVVNDGVVIGALLNYCHSVLACSSAPEEVRQAYRITELIAKQVVNFWKNYGPSLQEYPPSFTEKSDPRLSFSKMPFDFDNSFDFEATLRKYKYLEHMRNPEKYLPQWYQFYQRCDNGNAFLSFIGSIFVENSDRQQYLYMHGEGQNGKGSMMRLLRTLLGNAYASEDPVFAKNRFWTRGILGKRLVVFPDSNSPSFPQTGFFKTLTGDDQIRIEEKNGAIYSSDINAKFVFLSNEVLQISSSTADQRRAVYIEVGPLDPQTKIKATKDYDLLLLKEAEEFINVCRGMFLKDSAETGGKILVANNSVQALAVEAEEEYQMLFERDFELKPKSYIKASELLWILTKENNFDKRAVSKFKDWLTRTYQVPRKSVSKRIGSSEEPPVRVYEGFRSKRGR